METSTPDCPRPNIAHILAAVATILICLGFVGALVPGLILPDICYTISALMFLPWPVILAVAQYRGTFRRVPKSARRALFFSVLLAGLPFLILATVLTSGAALTAGYPFWLKWLAASVVTISIATANGHWCWQIETTLANGWVAPTSRTISLREAMLLVGAIFVVLCVAVPITRNAKPNQALHVTAEDTPFALPAGAHDVTYFRYHGGHYVQCTADEDAFLAWYNKGVGTLESLAANLPLSPIQKPIGANVITGFANNGPITEPQSVTSGWQYYWNKEDRWVSVIYDRPNKRLYYKINTR